MARRKPAAARPAAVAIAPKPAAAAVCAALVVAVVIVYAQLITHQFLDYDDQFYILQNPHVSTGLSAGNVAWAFTSFYASNWHPLTWISHMLDVQLFGLDAGRHLMTNVALHALSSALLFLVLRRATKSVWRSAIVAGFFALHPLHVESVAWVSERKDVLSTLFFIVTIWLYIAWVEKPAISRYLLMLVAFALGLMSKPMVISLPFVLLLLDWWPLARFTNVRQRIVEKLPLFALVIPSAILTLKAQQKAIGAIPLLDRIENAAISYAAYLVKTVWPQNLAAIYPLPASISPAAASLAMVFLLAVTAAAIALARKYAFLPTGWFWYLITLGPVIGIVQVGRQAMADRYTYIPLIGIFIAVVWLAAALRVPAVVAGLALIACGAVSYVQAGYWKDTITLSEHALSATSDNDVAQTMLGMALAKQGERAAAEEHLRDAVRINPSNEEALRLYGRFRLASGDPRGAIPLLEQAAKLAPDTLTRAMLANARGDDAAAVKLYEQALAEGEEVVDVHNDLAALLAKTGHDQEALRHYQEALRLQPEHYDAHMNLGALLSRMGRDHDAIAQFQAAARVRPEATEPHVYLALVYANRGQFALAENEVNGARAIDPIGSNREFTNAVHMPFKETNLQDYLSFLQTKR